MKIHPRYFVVNEADHKINKAVLAAVAEYNLSATETVKILLDAAQSYLKYSLREERHPNNPNKKADEA